MAKKRETTERDIERMLERLRNDVRWIDNLDSQQLWQQFAEEVLFGGGAKGAQAGLLDRLRERLLGESERVFEWPEMLRLQYELLADVRSVERTSVRGRVYLTFRDLKTGRFISRRDYIRRIISVM